jgi:hypothetical protein
MRSAGLGRIYSLLFETGKINSGDLSDKACKAVTDKPQIETADATNRLVYSVSLLIPLF